MRKIATAPIGCIRYVAGSPRPLQLHDPHFGVDFEYEVRVFDGIARRYVETDETAATVEGAEIRAGEIAQCMNQAERQANHG